MTAVRNHFLKKKSDKLQFKIEFNALYLSYHGNKYFGNYGDIQLSPMFMFLDTSAEITFDRLLIQCSISSYNQWSMKH